MFVQIKFFVGFVATQSTHIFLGNVIHRGFVHSFLVSSQIAFRCGIIDAWNLSRFDVTVKLLVFNMYVLVESKLLLSSKTFVTIVARRLNFFVDGRVMVTQCFFGHELLSTHVANEISSHIYEMCGVLFLPGRLADID